MASAAFCDVPIAKTIVLDEASRYVLDENANVYRKMLAKRDLISQSEEDALTPEQVEELARLSRLATDEDFDPPHILSEQYGGAPDR